MIAIEVFVGTLLIAKGYADFSESEGQFEATEIFDQASIESSQIVQAVVSGRRLELLDWHRCRRHAGLNHFHFQVA